MQADLGFAHFLTKMDGVATFLLTVLALMSIATWYLIVQKSAANWRMKRRRQDFLSMFWDAADLDAVCEAIVRISEFAADHADQVEEIDVNPLLARPDGAVALDALIVMRT